MPETRSKKSSPPMGQQRDAAQESLSAGPLDWTVAEAAAYLHLKPATLYALVAQGRIPAYKLDRLIRFRRTEIDHWLESHRVRPPAKVRIKAPPLPGDVETLIARAKRRAYNSHHGETRLDRAHRKGGRDGAL